MYPKLVLKTMGEWSGQSEPVASLRKSAVTYSAMVKR